MWFIRVEVEQETSAPTPKKNPGSAPDKWDQVPEKEADKVKNHVIKKLKACWPGVDPNSQVMHFDERLEVYGVKEYWIQARKSLDVSIRLHVADV